MQGRRRSRGAALPFRAEVRHPPMTPPDSPFAEPPAAALSGAGAVARGRASGFARHRRSGRPLLLVSGLLHILAVLLLLVVHRPEERQGAVAPASFDVVFEHGAPEGSPQASTPTEVPAPSEAVPQPAALPPPPAPPTPAAPPPPQAAAPPVPVPSPPPTPSVPAPAAAVAMLPPPIPTPQVPRFAEPPEVHLSLAPTMPLSPDFAMPAPAPEPAPAQRRRGAAAFPAPMDTTFGAAMSPVRRAARGTGSVDFALGRAARDSPGEPPREPDAAEGMIHVRGDPVGKDWTEQLEEWWVQHRYYPDQAAARGEDGNVQVHIRLDRYGRVKLVELESSSGSQWLDMGAQATFRGAQLPPLPGGIKEAYKDLDLTIEYILIRR
jgi:TonB family protein